MRAWIPVALSLMLATALRAQAAPASFDLVIQNGRIIDGTGSPWYSGDLGLRNGHIAAIGRLADAPAGSSSLPGSSTCSANPSSRSS
jgi:N-acyl-D-amino-acid deacylase